MAISSALQLADLALVWLSSAGQADLAMIDLDLASDRGLTTAAILSLLTDRRANDDDLPPSGDPTDRRGWWGDQFATIKGDKYGSRLWLLDRSTRTNETALKAKEYVLEGVAWMIEDKVIASADVTVETTRDGLFFAVALNRPGKDPVAFQFSHVWDHMQEDQ